MLPTGGDRPIDDLIVRVGEMSTGDTGAFDELLAAKKSATTVLHPAYLARFICSTAVLAMPPQAQQQWVATTGGGDVDELALDWDGGWCLLAQWVELDWLSADDAALFTPINQMLTTMSGKENAELWTTAALHTAPQWARVRELATSALFHLQLAECR